MDKFWIFILVVLSVSQCAIATNENQRRPALDLGEINLEKNVRLLATKNKIQIQSSSDNLLIQNSDGVSILLSNKGNVSFEIFGFNNSRNSLHNGTLNGTTPSWKSPWCGTALNYRNSTGDPEKETPVDLEKWRDHLLLNGSKKLDSWTHSTNLAYEMEACLFNITNQQEIIAGSKPEMEQICGYHFTGSRSFEVIDWQEDEKYVNVKQWRNYTYNGSLDLDQNVTTLNVPLVYLYNHVARNTIRRRQTRTKLHNFLNKYPLFITMSVRDLLVNGYSEQLLIDLQNRVDEWQMRLYLPKTFQEVGIRSVIDHKKSKHDGLWSYNTGKFSLNDVGQVATIDGRKQSNCWHKQPCASIKGTNGLVYSPRLNETNTTLIYEPELDRTVELVETNETLKNWRKFALSNFTFASSRVYGPNFCYQADLDEFNKHSGVLRRGECDANVPFAYSNPQFIGADALFKDQVQILNTTSAAIESKALVTRATSELVVEERSLQTNYDTRSISLTRRLKRFIFPVYWTTDTVIKTRKSL